MTKPTPPEPTDEELAALEAELAEEAAGAGDELRCSECTTDPFPDLRRLRQHQAEHRRKPCRYCHELYSPSGLGPHEGACQRRRLAAQVPPALEGVPRWLEGLAIPEGALERLVRFVTDAQEGGTLAAGMVVVLGPTWGPHLVKATSLPSVAAGHKDAAVLVLDAGRVAHELTLEAELAEAGAA